MEYAHGLPSTKLQIPQKKYEAWGLAWCRRIIDHANDWDLDPLVDFLIAGLLLMMPAERLSVDACLRKGRSIGLFDGRSSMAKAKQDASRPSSIPLELEIHIPTELGIVKAHNLEALEPRLALQVITTNY